MSRNCAPECERPRSRRSRAGGPYADADVGRGLVGGAAATVATAARRSPAAPRWGGPGSFPAASREARRSRVPMSRRWLPSTTASTMRARARCWRAADVHALLERCDCARTPTACSPADAGSAAAGQLGRSDRALECRARRDRGVVMTGLLADSTGVLDRDDRAAVAAPSTPRDATLRRARPCCRTPPRFAPPSRPGCGSSPRTLTPST